jgi:hypothetical protein
MQNNTNKKINTSDYLIKPFLIFAILVYFIFQFILVFNFDPYPESQTIISWYYGQNDIFDTLGMRVGDDNSIKGSYTFMYLLPSYLLFYFLKFFLVSDLLTLTIANLLIINCQFLLLFLASKRLSLNAKVTSLIFIIFFLTTFMWTGVLRIFPHDIVIILFLLQIIFPRLKYILMILMVYLDPIIGSLFVFFYYILRNGHSKNAILNNLSIKIFKILIIVFFGFSLWAIPIWYLENYLLFDIERGSILYRILGNGDEYFFTRFQIFIPFHYYLPNYIISIFPSPISALLFATSTGFSSFVSLYILYKYRFQLLYILNKFNRPLLYGVCFIFSYLIFALIFGQAAASHKFDYAQYFQFGIILCLSSLISKNMHIINTIAFKVIMAFCFAIASILIVILMV